MGIIAEVQHIDGLLEVKCWGVRTPVTPAALTPMVGAMNHVFLGIADFHR